MFNFFMAQSVRNLVRARCVLCMAAALLGASAIADEIRLIDDTIIRGKTTHRVANGVVVKRADGMEEILHPRMIKEIRIDGTTEWVSLSDVLGDGTSPTGSAPSGKATDGADTVSGPTERAVHLRIDLDLTNAADSMAILDAVWSDVIDQSPKGMVVSIDRVRLAPEIALELAHRLERLGGSVPKHLVIGETNLSTLVLVGAVDEVSWLPEGRVSCETIATAHHASFRDALANRIPRSSIEEMISGGPLYIDRDGKFTSKMAGRTVTFIGGATAVSCGLASAVLGGDGTADLAQGLPDDRRWRLEEISLEICRRRATKDKEDNARRLEKAAECSREIASAAADLRARAKAFDDFYKKHAVWRIWKKDAAWKSGDLQNESRDLQGAVRNSLLAIKNRATTLRQIVQSLPDTEPLRANYDACVKAAEAALDSLRGYERGILRNAQESYERGRGIAQSVRIGGC